jgi:hypothetical protein
MNDVAPQIDPSNASPPGRPSIYWPGLACWLPLCLAAAALWGGLTVLIQAHFSPVVLFPLLVGAVLGILCAASLRLCRTAHRPTALAGAILAACLLVVTQHYVSYRLARSAASEQKNMSLAQAAFPDLDLNFSRYLTREAAKGRPIAGFTAQGTQAWISWGVDGLLVIAATLAVVWLALRQPYCQTCHGWYRTVRTGQLSEAQVAGLKSLGFAPPADPPMPWQYSLHHCPGGCGPARFELSWDGASPGHCGWWLDVQRRGAVVACLDRAHSSQS